MRTCARLRVAVVAVMLVLLVQTSSGGVMHCCCCVASVVRCVCVVRSVCVVDDCRGCGGGAECKCILKTCNVHALRNLTPSVANMVCSVLQLCAVCCVGMCAPCVVCRL